MHSQPERILQSQNVIFQYVLYPVERIHKGQRTLTTKLLLAAVGSNLGKKNDLVSRSYFFLVLIPPWPGCSADCVGKYNNGLDILCTIRSGGGPYYSSAVFILPFEISIYKVISTLCWEHSAKCINTDLCGIAVLFYHTK